MLALAAVAGVAVAPLRIEGLVAATFTPFLPNGTLAGVDAVEAQADWLQKTGVRWAFVSGTTGESVKLSFAERREQAERWVRIAPKYNMSVIVHSGTDSIIEAIEHTKHAEAIGAQAVGWMPPVFFKPATVDALAATLAEVAAAAPSLPFYYYHIPSMTGVEFPILDLVKAIERIGVPNFAGCKYTGLYTFPGFMDARRVMAYANGKYEVLSGREDMMLEGVAAGCKGFVGSQFNHAGDLYNKVRNTCMTASPEESRKVQMIGDDLLAAWGGAVATGVNGNKNILNVVGGPNVGDGRRPNVPASADDLQKLKAGIQGWCDASSTAQETLICRTLASH